MKGYCEGRDTECPRTNLGVYLWGEFVGHFVLREPFAAETGATC